MIEMSKFQTLADASIQTEHWYIAKKYPNERIVAIPFYMIVLQLSLIRGFRSGSSRIPDNCPNFRHQEERECSQLVSYGEACAAVGRRKGRS